MPKRKNIKSAKVLGLQKRIKDLEKDNEHLLSQIKIAKEETEKVRSKISFLHKDVLTGSEQWHFCFKIDPDELRAMECYGNLLLAERLSNLGVQFGSKLMETAMTGMMHGFKNMDMQKAEYDWMSQAYKDGLSYDNALKLWRDGLPLLREAVMKYNEKKLPSPN